MILRSLMTRTSPLVVIALTAASLHAQSPETYSGTASVKTAGGAAATAPITIVVERKMPQAEAEGLVKAFTSGGAASLRKALAGVKPTGSVKLGNGAATPSRLTIERPTDKGRLITIVCDTPIMFVGGGMPAAKAKEGYDFALVDLVVDNAGGATGTLAPAAKVTAKQGVFVVQDYGAEVVQVTATSKK